MLRTLQRCVWAVTVLLTLHYIRAWGAASKQTEQSRESICSNQFSSVESLGHVQLFATPWTAARQASLSITDSQRSLKLMSVELVMPSNHLILCRPVLSPFQSFPASGSFPMSQFFASGGQRIGVSASASVLPMNSQG